MTRIPFDPEAIQRLAAILKDAGLTELELRDGDSHLRLMRTTPAAMLQAPPQPVPAATPEPATPPGEEPPPEGAVTSPMVGIAYLAPEPGASPYIALGQTVTAGQTLLLIEAMKTFNQVKAPRAGTITQILIAGGSPVEYGQTLLVIT